jgi:AcrR family transcriptional regulator
VSEVAEKPLRADARRNRAKVLEAARAVFAEQGREAQIDDVARRADVGVGTVYRHFPTKEALIGALVEDALTRIADEAACALENEDAWDAFERLLWRGAEIMAADRALTEVIQDDRGGPREVEVVLRDRMAEVMRRAQAAGRLRADATVDDIPMLMCGIGSATVKEHPSPEAWRRHLSIIVDGLRADSASGTLPG